jgi:hypothetical protein
MGQICFNINAYGRSSRGHLVEIFGISDMINPIQTRELSAPVNGVIECFDNLPNGQYIFKVSDSEDPLCFFERNFTILEDDSPNPSTTPTPSLSVGASPTPTNTPTPSISLSPTPTPSLSVGASPTPTPSISLSPTPTPSSSLEPQCVGDNWELTFNSTEIDNMNLGCESSTVNINFDGNNIELDLNGQHNGFVDGIIYAYYDCGGNITVDYRTSGTLQICVQEGTQPEFFAFNDSGGGNCAAIAIPSEAYNAQNIGACYLF